jgi:hypothetical protein
MDGCEGGDKHPPLQEGDQEMIYELSHLAVHDIRTSGVQVLCHVVRLGRHSEEFLPHVHGVSPSGHMLVVRPKRSESQ